MNDSYYPLDEDEGVEKVATSVRLPKDVHEDIELIVQLWNEFDRALGKDKSRKWKAASVIERLIKVGVTGFWLQVGGRPETKHGRQEFIDQAITKLKKQYAKK